MAKPGLNVLVSPHTAPSDVTPVDSDHPLPVAVVNGASTGTLADCSGSIAAGDTAQEVVAANSARRYFFIQNTSSGDLWIDFTTDAVKASPSILLTPGSAFVMEGNTVSKESVSIIGATTGQTFTAKEM